MILVLRAFFTASFAFPFFLCCFGGTPFAGLLSFLLDFAVAASLPFFATAGLATGFLATPGLDFAGVFLLSVALLPAAVFPPLPGVGLVAPFSGFLAFASFLGGCCDFASLFLPAALLVPGFGACLASFLGPCLGFGSAAFLPSPAALLGAGLGVFDGAALAAGLSVFFWDGLDGPGVGFVAFGSGFLAVSPADLLVLGFEVLAASGFFFDGSETNIIDGEDSDLRQ